MSAKKDDEEFVGHALHVTQMNDYESVPPSSVERPQTVWNMLAAADEESSKSRKSAKQSPSGAAHAEQEK